MQSTDPKRREDHGVVDEGLTIKMLEDLYQSVMIGVGEKKKHAACINHVMEPIPSHVWRQW